MKQPPKTKPAKDKILTLTITLDYLEPPIWRRVEVPNYMTLGDLHIIIQSAMGWQRCHMHEFIVKKQRYSESMAFEDLFADDLAMDEQQVRLSEVLKRKRSKLKYIYDFGDSWQHTVVVDSIEDPEPGQAYPRCTGGARSCPPEDSGGVGGYARMLQIVEDPNHPEHENYKAWLGEGFDPEAFDRDEAEFVLRAYGT